MTVDSSLSTALSSDDCVVFLGAGACLDSGLPLGDQAAKTIIKASFETLGLDYFSQRLAQLAWPRFEVTISTIAKYLPEAPNEITKTFFGIGLSSTHQILASLSRGSWLWLTTNFDDQIEESLRRTQKRFLHRATQDAMIAFTPSGGAQQDVIKLHGEYSVARSDLGATIDQVLRTFPEGAIDSIATAAAGRPLLCIGYSARDPDLRPLLIRLIKGASFVIWVDPYPSARSCELVKLNDRRQLIPQSCPKVFGTELGISLPPAERYLVWDEGIFSWARRQSAGELAQAIAAFCVDSSANTSRNVVPEILKLVPRGSPQHAHWEFETKAKLFAQLPSAKTELQKLVRERYEQVAIGADRVPEHLLVDSYVAMSQCFRSIGEFGSSLRLAKMVTEMLGPQTDGDRWVGSLCELGLAQVHCGAHEFKNGIQTLQKAMSLARECNLRRSEAQAALCLALGHIRADQGAQAEDILEGVKQIFQEVGDPRLQMEWKWRFAEALRIQGKYRDAQKLNREVIAEAELHDDFEVKQAVSCNLALCLIGSAEVKEADQRFRDVMVETSQRGRADCYANSAYNRGWLRAILGEWEDAAGFLLKAFEAYRNQAAIERAGGALSLAGWCLFRLGRRAEAIQIADRVRAEGLVPVGAFRTDFMTLDLALNANDPHKGLELLRRIRQDFDETPERQFFLLTWLLQYLTEHLAATDPVLPTVVTESVTILKKIDMPIYASVLKGLLEAAQLPVVPELVGEIECFSPRSVSELRSQLLGDQ